MAGQLVAQAQTVEEAVEPLESDIQSLSEPHADTHAVTGADGSEHVTGVFPPFDPSTFASQLLWLAITFAALYIIMSRIALPRIGSIIEDRRAVIDADLTAADASRKKTDAAIAAYEEALAAARRKSQILADESRARIKSDIDGRRKAVETDLAAKVNVAEARIQTTKREALTHVDEIAVDTVSTLVAQLTGGASEQDIRSAVAQAGRE